MILRCISDVPPAIVDETVLRYAVPCRPRIGAFSPRSCPFRARQISESGSLLRGRARPTLVTALGLC